MPFTCDPLASALPSGTTALEGLAGASTSMALDSAGCRAGGKVDGALLKSILLGQGKANAGGGRVKSRGDVEQALEQLRAEVVDGLSGLKVMEEGHNNTR